MASGKRFSRFIVWTLILLQGLSLTLVLGILFGILSRTMTREFYNKIQGQQVKVREALKDRFHELEAKLRELSLNNGVRVSLMLGVRSQLHEAIKSQYPASNGADFFVHEEGDTGFIPRLPETRRRLKPHLVKLTQKDHTQIHVLLPFGEHRHLTMLSHPIRRKNERLGTGFVLYDISQDNRFWKRIEASSGGKLYLHEKDGIFDLQTGTKAPLTEERHKIYNDDNEPLTIDRSQKVCIVPINEFPGLFYVASAIPLHQKKLSLIFTLAFLCAVVLILTLFVSYFIGRRMSKPLESLADQSLDIAQNPSNLCLQERDLYYIEFRKLARGFNKVLNKLLEAQERLKSRAKKDLDASEKRYRRTLEAAPDAITMSTLKDGRYLEANEAFCRMTGYSRDEVLGRTLFDLKLQVNPEDRARLTGLLEEKGEINSYEFQFRRKDGAAVDARLSARTTHFEDQDCLIEVLSDITERKQAEKALQESHQTLLTIFDSIDATIYVANLETHEILFINRYMKEVFGRQLEGEKCYKAFRNAPAPCPHCQNGKLIDERGEPTGVFVWEGENPITKRWYINYDRAIRWIDGRLVHFQIAVDISHIKKLERERLQTEAQLRKVQKMEAIGTLAGGVAHDLNNILTGIVSYPDLLLMQLSEDSPLRDPILTIQKTGKKATAIVQDLLTLARRGVIVNEVVNLNDIITEYLSSPEYAKLMTFHKGIVLEKDFDEDLLNIMGSSVHLSKSVMNLVSNAAEAMPDGGTIRITTANRYLDQSLSAYENVKEGDYVVLTVEDAGVGISPEDKERIFEPFFTKKVMGRSGTGLGMAVVWGTVKDHEGYIDVKTTLGAGTTFTLFFPITRKDPNPERSSLPVERYKGRGESILVIDDVKEQRDIASMMLSTLGYSVRTVSSGEEAVRYLSDHAMDLLILDMIMDPGMDGLDTYRSIVETHPSQKAIIASGYSETDRVKKAQELGAGQYIKKPYTMESIGMAVRTELDGAFSAKGGNLN